LDQDSTVQILFFCALLYFSLDVKNQRSRSLS
jgi:hypothetical protein